jgi:LCP family protein required for cell wall assembly
MNYEDDELERMRARRPQQRRNGAPGRSFGYGRGGAPARDPRGSGGRGRTASAPASQRAPGGSRAFHSSYSGPKGGETPSHGAQAHRGSNRGIYRRRKRQDRKKKIIIILLTVMAVLALAIGGTLWYFYQKTWGSLAKIEFNESAVLNANLSPEQIEGMKGYMTVACFGVDSRMDKNGNLNVGKGTNADVNLIASINLETGEIRLVSVFRDTYLNITDKNSYNKINAAYAQGGPEQAVKALNKNLGLNITQYATFNWKAVADAINILGGVDVDLSESEFSWINAYISETVKETGLGSVQLTHAGENIHLDGVQAVAYGRLRLGDTDYARTERQRIILNKAFEKAKQADWATLNNIIQTVTPQLATNVTPADLIPLARNITRYHMGETSGFPAARGEMNVGDTRDCVIPKTLEFNVRILHEFLFDETDYDVPSNVLEYSRHIANVTGMSTEGKVIGHVPVDQGLNASVYVRRRAERQAQQEAKARETEEDETEDEESTDETGESSTDESGTEDESTFDPEEDWPYIDWGDNWPDEDWEEENPTGPGGSQSRPGGTTTRPGTSPSQPGGSTTKPGTSGTQPGGSTTKPGTSPTQPGTTRPNQTTEADEENGGQGPGGTGTTPPRYEKPGSQTTQAYETEEEPGSVRPPDRTPETGSAAPGNRAPSGQDAPGSSAPGGTAPGAGQSANNAPSDTQLSAGGSGVPGGGSSSPGGGSAGPGA